MTTCEPLPSGGEEDDLALISYAEASLASPSVQPAGASPRMTPGGYGLRWRRSFADYDPATRSWRTFQGSLLAEWEMYSETWPRAGMTRNGTAYQRQPSAPLIREIASGLWPTPRTTGLDGGSNSRKAAKRRGMWPNANRDGSRGEANHARTGNLTLQGAAAGVNPVDAARLRGQTPTARDWRSGKSQPGNDEPQLAPAQRGSDRTTSAAGRHRSHRTRGRTAGLPRAGACAMRLVGH